jgi:hypothetical protein
MDRQVRSRGNGYALSRDLTPRLVPIAGCKPLGRETRKHPPHQVRKLAASLTRFGFALPILIDAEGRVVAGWGLVLAARQLGLSEVPAVSLTDLSEAELRMLRLALNRITKDAVWDRALMHERARRAWAQAREGQDGGMCAFVDRVYAQTLAQVEDASPEASVVMLQRASVMLEILVDRRGWPKRIRRLTPPRRR